MVDIIRREFEIANKKLVVETGKVARQADGAVTLQMGGTVVLATVVASNEPREGIDFVPLTVDVVERMYAAGKIPGGFIKREGRPSEKAILNARLIDRPLRPNFPKGFNHEIHIMVTILSVDQIHPPDILAVNGASYALMISSIPFNGPIGAVQVGRLNGKWLVNPTLQELVNSDINLKVAGTKEAIVMVEAGSNEVSENDIVEAIEVAHEQIKEIVEQQQQFCLSAGKEKMEFSVEKIPSELEEKVRHLAVDELKAAVKQADKTVRDRLISKITEDVLATLEEESPEELEGNRKLVKNLLKEIEKEIVRQMILKEGVRVDGRKPDEIRSLSTEAGLLPRTHGSGLFTRGQTQVLSVVTLGTMREEQMIDGLGIEESKRFIHHYNFPPFSVGEPGRLGIPKRREVGHGALAEKALLPTIPDEDKFPYAIRIVSDVLESNGSTSMASVCASSMALMDAGIPVSAAVGGVAMGLVKEGDSVAVLTDIQGLEDALGDMDFKVAGTSKGVTALQMDIKIPSVDSQILREALTQARRARMIILDKMAEAISAPRKELSPYAPRIIQLKVPVDKIREIIGPGGKVIQGIIAETGTTIDIEDDGTVYVASKDVAGGKRAKNMIEAIIKEVEPGDIFVGRVTKTMPFGAFVELKPGREGLVHISKLAKKRIGKVEDIVHEGDRIAVRVLEIDQQNRVSLTAIDVDPEKKVSIQ